MKTKKLSQKLVLKKETIASLQNREMNSALGGATTITVCNCLKTIKNGCTIYNTYEYETCLTCITAIDTCIC